MTIPGRYSQIQRACGFVAEGARLAGFNEKAIFQLELACDEACTNVIEHAYGGEDRGELTVSYAVTPDCFILSVHDRADRRFDPDAVPEPAPMDEENTRIGGLGLHLIRKTMDEVAFTFSETEGNRLTMKKQLPDRGAP